MKTMTQEEWVEEGKRLFGDDMFKWRFKCPACGHVASVEDFRAYKDQGASPDSATNECIGRYLPKSQRGGWSRDHCNPKVKQPCDYAGYGLIGLSPVRVERADGKHTDCFAFDDGDTGKEVAVNAGASIETS